jgi:ribosome-binding protein aMBF1 (putative translation factor)
MSAELRFRNVDASPDAPVEDWPAEAIHTALDRGSLTVWRRIARAIRDDPWGSTARQVEEVLGYDQPYGVATSMSRVIAQARDDAEASARREVASRLQSFVRRSGLSKAAFAQRLGTSASRLSTYLAGTVTPSAALMVRAERVVKAGRRAG